MSVTIRVPYEGHMLETDAWEELLGWCINTFGLPEQYAQSNDDPVYDWYTTEEYMSFTFDSESDALVFQLRSLGIRTHE
jgi:hypothetical protein